MRLVLGLVGFSWATFRCVLCMGFAWGMVERFHWLAANVVGLIGVLEGYWVFLVFFVWVLLLVLVGWIGWVGR